MGEQYLYVAPSAGMAGARVVPPCYIGEDVRVGAAPGSARWPCSAPAPWSAKGATVLESVVQAGVVIGAHAQVERSIVVRGRSVGAGTQLNDAVLGEGCRVGAGNRLVGGICLYPETSLPDDSIQFTSELRGREG